MLKISIDKGTGSGFADNEIEALALTLHAKIPDCEVRVETPWLDQDVFDCSIVGLAIETIRDQVLPTVDVLTVKVPWDALTSAAAAVMLESIRDWLKERSQARRSRPGNRIIAEEQATADPKIPDESLRPAMGLEVHSRQVVRIFGPNGELLGVVSQKALQDVPTVVVHGTKGRA